MTYTFTIKGEVPSKKRAWRISRHGGMYLEKRVKDWNEAAGWEIKAQHMPKLAGKIEVSMIFHMSRDRDLDNVVTTILDLMQEVGIVDDDKNVVTIQAMKKKSKEPRVEVQFGRID